MPLGPGAPKWKDITDVLGSAMGYVEPVGQALAHPLEAIGLAGPQAQQLFAGNQPTTPIAPAMEYFGIDPATAQSVAETADMFLPQAGAIRGGSPFMRRQVSEALRKGKKYPGLAQELRKTAKSGHTLLEELPPAIKPAPGYEIRGTYMPPREYQVLGKMPGEISVVRGGPNVRSTAHHEAVAHRAEETLSRVQKARLKDVVDKMGPHPSAGSYSKDKQAMESFTFGVQEILDGQPFSGSPQLEAAIYEIIGSKQAAQKGLLSDLATSANIPLMEKEIDPLLRALELK